VIYYHSNCAHQIADALAGGTSAMPVTHEPWLVALSVVVAIQGAYVGLSLAVQVGGSSGVRQRMLLAAAAVSLAVAIWAMHFVGMLAVRVTFLVDFLAFPTLLSFLVCVLVVGAAVFAASGPLTLLRLAAASVVMGCGIVTMHYIGMSAWQGCARMVHAPTYVAAATAIAIAACGLALWLASGRGGRLPLLLSATVLGLAISGMHYTAMGGMTMFPLAGATAGAPVLSSDLLAIVVAVVAFLVSGMFLLFLLPDRTDDAPARVEARPPRPAAAFAGPALDRPHANGYDRVDASLGRAADVPPRRLARHLPVQRDGATHFVAIDDVVAVHANAHYTFIFNGSAKLFCPLAIGDVESRLDTNRFIRVHRSHIVNIDRVAGLRRAGDNGVVELAGTDRYTVPVSRSRFGPLKTRLELRVDAAFT
jgi:NO-binding membrane sensor protein with MHYT domain